MKCILFTLTSFRHGGTNKSLENLLSLIDTDKYRVEVFAMEHYGPYKEMLSNCTILPEDKWLSALIAHWADLKGFAKIRSFVVKVLRKVCLKINFNIKDIIYKKALDRLVKNKNYDAVIAYSEGAPTAFISLLYHKNKITWVHCDYSSYMQLNKHPDEKKIYKSYKSIVCVSEYTKKVFYEIMPEMQSKVFAIHNLVNSEEIIVKSLKKIEDNRFVRCDFNIISVGRIDVVKRFDRIPEMAVALKKKGIKFIWYLIGSEGFGVAQARFEYNIKKNKIENAFIWLGVKDNPYSYIANSDLLVITSESEACPYVLNEAKILGVPTITTNYGSAIEFIDNEINGIITPIEAMVDEIEKYILNKKLYNVIKKHLQEYKYENKEIMDRVYLLIDSL